MTTLLHLSDLHLAYEPGDPRGGAEAQYVARVRAMVRAIGKLRDTERPFAEIDALALTGDILDTSVETEEHTRAILRHLVTELRGAVGRDAPILMLPGNHDRRRVGLLSSGAPVLAAMRALTQPVGDPTSSDLRERIPEVFTAFADDPVKVLRLPGIDYPFVLTDSTHLDGGLVGAGGTVRSADLLAVHAELSRADKAPVFWLLHHHLVPTPMTDLQRSGSGRFTEGFAKWATQTGLRAARAIISNVDREELTMTAMGAGTVLSCMHTMRRPVLVLHGHKHYPTARLLKGIRYGENDVALLSAGSAGVTETPDARLLSVWPSFNAMRIERGDEGTHSVHVTIVAFPPAGHPDEREIRCTALVSLASRTDHPVLEVREPRPRPHVSEWTRNEASYRLDEDGDVVHAVVSRRVEVVEGTPSAKEGEWCDHLDGLPGASVRVVDYDVGLPSLQKFHLVGTRGEATYTITKALAANADAAGRFYDESTPYEWIGLPNRYPCAEVRLRVEFTAARLASAFASITNLATGMEMPVQLERGGDAAWAVVEACPPRHLLRIYWRLPKRAGA